MRTLCLIGALSLLNAQSVRVVSNNQEGRALLEQGRCREALRAFEAELVAAREEQSSPTVQAIAIGDVGAAHTCLGNFPEAERRLRNALAVLHTSPGPDPELTSGILNNLGLVLARRQEWAEAEATLERALAIRESAIVLNSMGEICHRARRHDAAERYFRRAIAIWERTLAADHPYLATGLNNLGTILVYQGKVAEARELIQRALEMRVKLLPPGHPEIAQSLFNYAACLKRMGRRSEAKAAARQAEAIRAKHHAGNRTSIAVDWKSLRQN